MAGNGLHLVAYGRVGRIEELGTGDDEPAAHQEKKDAFHHTQSWFSLKGIFLRGENQTMPYILPFERLNDDPSLVNELVDLSTQFAQYRYPEEVECQDATYTYPRHDAAAHLAEFTVRGKPIGQRAEENQH